MKPIEPTTGLRSSALGDSSAPDVLWGQHGIDALFWADPPPPYESPPQQAVTVDDQSDQAEAAS